VIGPVYESGRVIGASIFSRDITEQKRVENQLKESERRFRRLAEAIRDVFYILDPVKRETIYVSPGYEEVYGRPLETVYSDPISWMESVHPDDRDIVQNDFSEMMRCMADGYRGNDYRIVKPDQSVRWIQHRAYVIRDDRGEAVQIAGVVTDVTAAKEAEKELHKAHQELRKAHGDLELRVEERTRELQATSEAFERSRRLASIGTLAAGIAHEINNPIGSILMAADMALLSLGDPQETGEVKEALESVKEDAKRAGRIVKTVLQLSRQEVSRKWPQDIGDIARRALDSTRRSAETYGVTVEIEVGANLPKIAVNPTEIEQALVNVITNAIEASQRGQSVSVRLDSDDRQVRIVLEDSGHGIDRDEISRVFDPFYSTRQSEGGTGLGLSLTHSIVHLHGGTIEIDSELGKGTRVTIGFPRADLQGGEVGHRSDEG
jgi:PAS domain S-box-containing protein